MKHSLRNRSFFALIGISITFVTQAAPLSESCYRENNIARDQCAKKQSKGFSVCIHEKLSPDCVKETLGKLPSWSPDYSCLMEIEREGVNCGDTTAALMKQCWRERLSNTCMKQVEAGAGSQADATCKQELHQAAGPCNQVAILGGKQCLEKRLSAKCSEQQIKAEQGMQTFLVRCQEAQKTIRQLCGTDIQKGQQCYLQHQAELSVACQ